MLYRTNATELHCILMWKIKTVGLKTASRLSSRYVDLLNTLRNKASL